MALENIDIINEIGEPAALEQLAEESAELAQAALKLARILRKENPTPKKFGEGFHAFQEELADVRLCIRVYERHFGVIDTGFVEDQKLTRWKTRLVNVAQDKAKAGIPPKEEK